MSSSRRRGNGLMFRVVCQAAATMVNKRVTQCGMRAIKAAVKIALGPVCNDLEGAIFSSADFTQDLTDWLLRLLETPGPRQILHKNALVLLQLQADKLTELVNLRVPPALRPRPLPQPARDGASRARASSPPQAVPAVPRLALDAASRPHLTECSLPTPIPVPDATPRTPPPVRTMRVPTLQPRTLGERVGPRGDPRYIWPVPHDPLPFAHNPHAAFALPVMRDSGELFLFKRIVSVMEYPNRTRFVELEWEPTLVPLRYIPRLALSHVTTHVVTVEEGSSVVVGGTAMFAVEGVIETVSTPHHQYARVKWTNTLEPIANVDADQVEEFMAAFQSHGYRRLEWQ